MQILIAKPFSLLKFSSLLALRILLITTVTWLHMVKSAVSSVEHFCRRILLWLCAVVFLPFQALTAVRREKMVSAYLFSSCVTDQNYMSISDSVLHNVCAFLFPSSYYFLCQCESC